jgi:hypothetical protein
LSTVLSVILQKNKIKITNCCNIVIYKVALYNELGDPFSEDSIRLHKISPLFHTQNVIKPLMVLQGANDPGVLQVESDEIVEGVRANYVPVDTFFSRMKATALERKKMKLRAMRRLKSFWMSI